MPASWQPEGQGGSQRLVWGVEGGTEHAGQRRVATGQVRGAATSPRRSMLAATALGQPCAPLLLPPALSWLPFPSCLCSVPWPLASLTLSPHIRAQGDPFKTIFVGRLSFEVTERKLRREFEEFGPIKRIRLVHEKNSGVCLLCGFGGGERGWLRGGLRSWARTAHSTGA